MSALYKLTKDITGATSGVLGFTDEQHILYFNDAPPTLASEEYANRQIISEQITTTRGLENIRGQYQSIYAPTTYEKYVIEILAAPLAPYQTGINSIVAQIRYFPDPAGSQRGYCIYNGQTIYRLIVGGSWFVVNLPRNATYPIIDNACNIYFNFYNL